MKIDRPIAIALILFIILLLVFFLVVPEYNKFKILQADLGEKRAEFNAEFDYYNAIANTYSQLQTRQDSLKKIDDALPIESNLGNLVYYLQNKALENGIIIRSLFLSKPSAANAGEEMQNVKELSFSLSLLGSYSSLGNFIRSLEKSARLFEISSISFNSNSGQFSSGSISSAKSQFQTPQLFSFSLELKTYSY